MNFRIYFLKETYQKVQRIARCFQLQIVYLEKEFISRASQDYVNFVYLYQRLAQYSIQLCGTWAPE